MTHPDRPQPVHDLSPREPYAGDADRPAPGWTRIPPQSGLLVRLEAGEVLEIVDPLGEQVSDLYLVCADDVEECFSSGRTTDYNNTLYVSVGDRLWSNRSRGMATIVADTVGVHDMTLTPCSQDTFDILYPDLDGAEHPSCFANLCAALQPEGVSADRIGTTLNVFMDVWSDRTGELHIDPPPTRPGDRFAIRAELPLLAGVTACSAEKSNNGQCKPIDVRVST
jgi:uncharacterized protein